MIGSRPTHRFGFHQGVCRRTRHRASGATLLELLVALLVLTVAMMLASQLLLEGQSRAVFEAQRTLEPVVDLAVDQLRADLRLSAGVDRPLFGGWERGPMRLLGHPAGRVVYDNLGGTLSRRVETGGEGSGERPLLTRVRTFRWRVASDGAVDLELEVEQRQRLRAVRAGGDLDDVVWANHRRVLRVVPRGGAGARW